MYRFSDWNLGKSLSVWGVVFLDLHFRCPHRHLYDIYFFIYDIRYSGVACCDFSSVESFMFPSAPTTASCSPLMAGSSSGSWSAFRGRFDGRRLDGHSSLMRLLLNKLDTFLLLILIRWFKNNVYYMYIHISTYGNCIQWPVSKLCSAVFLPFSISLSLSLL